MGKKYELTDETIKISERTLHRIKALIDFNDVKAGDLGGYVETEENLSQFDNCWVYDNAKVYANAVIYSNAEIHNNAQVRGTTLVGDDAEVYDNAEICGNAFVYGKAEVYDTAVIRGTAEICDNARVGSKDDYATVSNFGSVNRTTTFFKQKDGSIGVRSGCFGGTIDEFRDRVRKKYEDNYLAEEYLMIANLMEMRFKNRERAEVSK